MGLMHCFARPMLRDRVVALRKANVFAPHTYRQMTSGLQFTQIHIHTIDMQSNYVVVPTLSDEESRVFQAARYIDRGVLTAGGRRCQRKRAVYDTSRVQTRLVTPV